MGAWRERPIRWAAVLLSWLSFAACGDGLGSISAVGRDERDAAVPEASVPDVSVRDAGLSVADASMELAIADTAPDGESDAGEFDPFGDANRAVRDARPPPRPRDVGAPPSTNDDDAGDSATTDDGGSVVAPDAPPPCTTTECILAAQSADCLRCARGNGTTDYDCFDPAQQQGTCEDVKDPGTPDDAATYEIEAPRCRKTLQHILDSRCVSAASLFQLTPCLCGSTDGAACVAGTATPTGPLYQEYADDFCSGPTCSTTTIMSNFLIQTYGAGAANALVQCLAAYSCVSCFGVATPSGEGGADP